MSPRHVMTVLAVLMLVGGLAPVSAQPTGPAPEPRPLIPAQGQLITGATEVAIDLPRQLGPDGPFVRQVTFFNTFLDPASEQQQRFPVGIDTFGVDNGEGPRCDVAPGGCVVDGVWRFFWEPFEDSPTGPQSIDLQIVVCPGPDSAFEECDDFQIDRFFDVVVDLTPPALDIAEPPAGAEIDVGERVPLIADLAEGGEAVMVEWTFQPISFLGGKGLPLKDQHLLGGDLSGDLDDDDRPGDMSCAPTAAASSLSWFAMDDAERYGDLLPEGEDAAARMKALVDRLGELAGTGDNGTSVARLKKAIEDHLEDSDLDDDFDVELDEDPTATEIGTEFGRGQDVLVGIYGDGFAHRVAVENVTSLEDGSTVINIMDPWTGLVGSITVGPDGQAQYDVPWHEDQGPEDVTLRRMIHVSPSTDDDEAPVDDAGGFAGAAEVPGQAITWDTTGVAPGEYLVRATATDANGTSQTASRAVTIAGEPPADEAVRLAGAGREQTAVAISMDAYDDQGAAAAVLARSDAFPDALAGTPLADEVGGPLLLTGSSELSPVTATELQRALPDGATVYLLGGEAALSADVADAVEALGFTTTRLGGASRVETAAVIAEQGLGGPDTVLLTTGDDFPDALSAGVAAAALDGAVLLTAGGAVPGPTQAYVDGVAEPTVFAVGGPAAQAAPDATPIVGASRFETAVLVAERFFSAPADVGVATGTDFPDALAGGAHIARLGGPILLTGGDALPDRVRAYLAGDAATIATAHVYGGTGVVGDAVVAEIAAAIS